MLRQCLSAFFSRKRTVWCDRGPRRPQFTCTLSSRVRIVQCPWASAAGSYARTRMLASPVQPPYGAGLPWGWCLGCSFGHSSNWRRLTRSTKASDTSWASVHRKEAQPSFVLSQMRAPGDWLIRVPASRDHLPDPSLLLGTLLDFSKLLHQGCLSDNEASAHNVEPRASPCNTWLEGIDPILEGGIRRHCYP